MKKRYLLAADGSENYIEPVGPGEAIETRWVRRGDRGIVYLSSQTACAQGCKMCWLTATGQTRPTDLSPEVIYTRAFTAVKANEQATVTRVHFNFMARGEFFANRELTDRWTAERLVTQLLAIPQAMFQVRPAARVLISTIMPRTFKNELSELFVDVHPEIYYSLYTVNPEVHKKWFPAAMDPRDALAKLKRWQDHSAKIPKIHLALIKGVNDDFDDLADIRDAIQTSGLRCDFNLVRYNPPNAESQEANDMTYRMAARMFDAQIVNRVGTDVYASCGMFASDEDFK